MSDWVITIPVISTYHIPGMEALDRMTGLQSCARDDEDYLIFVRLDEIDEDLPWLHEIADWTYRKHNTYWVRFDQDGDVIEELPKYETEWEEQ